MPGVKSISDPEPRLIINAGRRAKEPASLAEVRAAAFETDLGWMAAQWQGGKLARLSFGHDSSEEALTAIGRHGFVSPRLAHAHRALVARLRAYGRGAHDDFADVPVLLAVDTQFALRVIEVCRGIGYGCTLSYGQVATVAGSPGAARAVGAAMAKNRICLFIPCHRVVGSTGLGGWSGTGGLAQKQALLDLERGR